MSKGGIHILCKTSFNCENADIVQLKTANLGPIGAVKIDRRSYAQIIIAANCPGQLLCDNFHIHDTFLNQRRK